MDSVRGAGALGGGSVASIINAAQAFLGSAGILPSMGRQLAVARRQDKEAILAHVDAVAKWVEDSRRALGCLEGNGDVR